MFVPKGLLTVVVLVALDAHGKSFFDQPVKSETQPFEVVDLEAHQSQPSGAGQSTPSVGPSIAESEQTLFHRAAEETDAKRKLERAEEFLRAFPESRYVDAARYVRFLGLRDSGDDTAALAAAQAILTRNPTREDVLFYVAHRYFNEKRELKKVIDYCYTVIAILEIRTKPHSIDEAQWSEQRDLSLFQTHWLKGSAHLQLGEWELADKSLRSALAVTKGTGKNIPAVVSSLAWTNYQMKRIPETIRLYDQCSRGSDYETTCKQSAAFIRNEYALQ